MSDQTLFGKSVRELGKNQPVQDTTSDYTLHPAIDPSIMDGLNELGQMMIARISNSTATYPDGRLSPYTIEHRKHRISIFDITRERNEGSPLAQMALDYLRQYQPTGIAELENGLSEDAHGLSYDELVARDKPITTPPIREIVNKIDKLTNQAIKSMSHVILSEKPEGSDNLFVMIHPRYVRRPDYEQLDQHLAPLLRETYERVSSQLSEDTIGDIDPDEYERIGGEGKLVCYLIEKFEALGIPPGEKLNGLRQRALDNMDKDITGCLAEVALCVLDSADQMSYLSDVGYMMMTLEKYAPAKFKFWVDKISQDELVMDFTRTVENDKDEIVYIKRILGIEE